MLRGNYAIWANFGEIVTDIYLSTFHGEVILAFLCHFIYPNIEFNATCGSDDNFLDKSMYATQYSSAYFMEASRMQRYVTDSH